MSILQLTNGVLSDFQKWRRYFNGTAIAAFFRVAWATAFLNNLAFYSEDLKLMVLAIFALKVVAS